MILVLQKGQFSSKNCLFLRKGRLVAIWGVRQQERVGGYCVSMKQSLHNSATESRGLEYVATFLIS